VEEDAGIDTGSGGDGGFGAFGGRGGLGGGAGSSGGFAGSGAIGGGGGTGGILGCNGLIQIQPSVTVAHPDNEFDSHPALTHAIADGQDVSVVFARSPVESPSAFVSLRHASFSPWQSWPPGGLDSTYGTFAAATLSTEFRVASAGMYEFALAVAHPNIVSLAPKVAAFSENPGPTVTLSGAATPVFLREQAEYLHLAGTLSSTNELQAHVVNSASGFGSMTTIGCASTQVFGGAVRHEDGWLVAYSNGQNAPATGFCASSVGAGPPSRIDIIYLSPSLETEYRLGLVLATPVIGLSVARHPNGIYVVWREASGGIVSPIRWVRYDATLAGFIGPGDVSTPTDFPLEFTATALGDRLVVAYGTDPAGNPPDIVLRVLDPSGAEVASTAFEPQFSGRLALLASPNFDSLLLAYRGGGAVTPIELTRFDCIP
jgi:hypothetical protein